MAEDQTSDNAYDVVLADLEKQLERVQNAIAAIKALRGQHIDNNQGVKGVGQTPSDGPIAPGTFHGMSIADAVKQLLASRKKPLGTQEITESIMAGGVVFSTDTPANTVGSVLHRQATKVGDIISVGRGKWALAAWYPNPDRFRKKRVIGAAAEDPNATVVDAGDMIRQAEEQGIKE